MDPFSIGASLLSFGLSFAKGKRAKREARAQIRFEKDLLREDVARLEKQEEVLLGQQKQAVASNMVDVNSASALALRSDTIAEFDREEKYMRLQSAQRQRSIKAGGRSAAARAFGQSANALLDMGSFWWANKRGST